MSFFIKKLNSNNSNSFNILSDYMLIIIVVLLPFLIFGQQQINPDSALVMTLAKINGTAISLDLAVNLALENATIVHEARAAFEAAVGNLRSKKGEFDPELFIETELRKDDHPTASPFSGASVLSTDESSASAGTRMRLPIGTEIEASLNASRFKTNSAFSSLNPQYNSFGSISFRQPLLAGFGPAARRELAVAKKKYDASKSRYDYTVLQVRASVEVLYWELYTAERDYAVQQLIREQAQALLQEAQTRAKAGLVGPNQVANAQVFLAEQELNLLDREEQMDRVSDQLSSLIGKRPEAGYPRFITIEEPPLEFPIEPIETIVEKALKNNYELHAVKSDVESVRAHARAAHWDKLPTLDFLGSIGGSGLSGEGRDVIFVSDTLRSTLSGNMIDALHQVTRRDFPNWSLGLQLTVPIGLRSRSGEYQRMQAEVIRAEQQYLAAANSLEEDVRANNRALMNGAQRLQIARTGVDAAQEQVRIGLIEFRNGRSTAFELVRLGADFAAAQKRYSEALVRTAKAAAFLKLLTSGEYPSSVTN
jgi:outer membrane protein TolC